ncbi:MAG: rod shape-determining protein MreC [Saprospiraceae bacterium]|nr:rod shape-determining protein MreC [Lewinella sp.]
MTTFKRVRRFGNWVTFLILEAISLALVVEYNQYQNEIFIHSANVLTGNLNEGTHSIGQYFSLTGENERLQQENSKLLAEVNALKQLLPPQDSSIHAPELHSPRFEFIPAKVINKTLLGQNNYFTINLGRHDSIDVNMGVIGDQGLVGIVTNVSKHHAKVMTLLHPLARISASIQGQSFYGSLSWDGHDPYHMILEDIPKEADINIGDNIITSGYSNLFPPDIIIGTIESADNKAGDGGHTITVKLINDLSSLTYAYVLKDRMKEDLKQLEE